MFLNLLTKSISLCPNVVYLPLRESYFQWRVHWNFWRWCLWLHWERRRSIL